MSVWFCYRCPYRNPGGFHARRFDAPTVLDWFRSVWQPVRDPAEPPFPSRDHAERLVGRHVYGFGSLFAGIAEHGWPPPRTMRELAGRLNDALYVGDLKSGPHHVQVLTDDDEIDMAVYVFDNHYAARHPARAAFLAREDWRLPDGAADGPFRPATRTPALPTGWAGPGATYFVCTAHDDGGSLGELSDTRDCHLRLPGVRLPDLPRWLLAGGLGGDAPGHLHRLRDGVGRVVDGAAGDEGALLRAVAADPGDALRWAAYSDWLEDRGHPPAGEHLLRLALPAVLTHGDLTKHEIHVGRHVAQAGLHDGDIFGEDCYRHLLLFDDQWAAAHPLLADGALRFASRWDVL